MSRGLRFVLALVVGLGLVTWVASVIVSETTRGWFERDLDLRGQLAVNGARASLLLHWSDASPRRLDSLLTELTRDERVMAAAACGANLRLLAKTRDYPAE